MIRARIPCLAILLMLAAVFFPLPFHGQAANPTKAVTLTPSVVESGSPELIRVTIPNAQEVTGDWLGKKLTFFHGSDGQSWYALAGLDVEAPVGPSTLKIETKHGEETNHFEAAG